MDKNKMRIRVLPYTVAIFIMMVLFEVLQADIFIIKNSWLSRRAHIVFITFIAFVFLSLLKRSITRHYEDINQELTNANISAEAANQQLLATNQELQATEEELRSTNDELNQQQQDLDMILQTIPEGIIRTDDKGKVLFCNKRILEDTGLSRGDLLDKDIKNIVLLEEQLAFAKEFAKVFDQGLVKEMSFHNRKGTQVIADMVLLKDKKSHIIGTLTAIREFSKTGKIIEELANSKKELHQKIEEMQILHRTTIDREKRIIALKEQVEKLKQELAKGKDAKTL